MSTNDHRGTADPGDPRGRPVVFSASPEPPPPAQRWRTVGGIALLIVAGVLVIGGTVAIASPAGPTDSSDPPPPIWYIPRPIEPATLPELEATTAATTLSGTELARISGSSAKPNQPTTQPPAIAVDDHTSTGGPKGPPAGSVNHDPATGNDRNSDSFGGPGTSGNPGSDQGQQTLDESGREPGNGETEDDHRADTADPGAGRSGSGSNDDSAAGSNSGNRNASGSGDDSGGHGSSDD